MEMSRDRVTGIANLARLKLNEGEIERYQKELVKILRAFDDLAQVPIPKELEGDARSAITAAHAEDCETSRVRADVIKNTLSTKDFLSASPDKDGAFVKVPAILERTT